MKKLASLIEDKKLGYGVKIGAWSVLTIWLFTCGQVAIQSLVEVFFMYDILAAEITGAAFRRIVILFMIGSLIGATTLISAVLIFLTSLNAFDPIARYLNEDEDR